MNKEKQKEKIKWSFVFAVSIPATVVISIISVFIIPIIIDNTNCGGPERRSKCY